MKPHIAISYNYGSDIDFVRTLAVILQTHGVDCWYLETVKKKQRDVVDYLGGDFDWQEEPQNWQATFLEHLLSARGVIVVFSPLARESHQTEGRGMWRERPAINFISADNPSRVLEIDKFEHNGSFDSRVAEIIAWGRRIIRLPEANRQTMAGDVAASFNIPTGQTGPLQLPERKSNYREWYELVRLDLYDGQWHCRCCGLSSWNYIIAHENPPCQCPRCGYSGEVLKTTNINH
jgi:hypothetical protein